MTELYIPITRIRDYFIRQKKREQFDIIEIDHEQLGTQAGHDIIKLIQQVEQQVSNSPGRETSAILQLTLVPSTDMMR